MSKLPTEPPRVVVQKMGSYIVRYRGRAFFTFMVYGGNFLTHEGDSVPLPGCHT